MLRYHHSIALSDCCFGEIEASPEISLREGEDFFIPAYSWLAGQIGHWPLFLAVGNDDDAMRITGYQNQWRRILSSSATGNTYRRKGEFPSRVLFSFHDLPEVSFSDYHNWHIPLNGGEEEEDIERLVLAPGRSSELWLRKAGRRPGSVQGHVSKLDLRSADRIWCRSRKASKQLQEIGFAPERIEVQRLNI